ncbi:MAG: hypothetical protein HOP14_06090 [Acidobacteria bacterium]|nr:hypothetical protein [Acidobacteriota bacterium]
MANPLQTYRAPGITVTYDPALCQHAAECVRTLPAVFDISQKPWVQPAKASVADVVSTIARCPSGALQYTLEPADGDSETR